MKIKLILLLVLLIPSVVNADALGVKSGDYELTLNDCPTRGQSCVGAISIDDKSVSLDITVDEYRFLPSYYDITPYFSGEINPYTSSFYFTDNPVLNQVDDVLVLNAATSGTGSWWLGEAIICDYYPGICGIIHTQVQGSWYNPKAIPEPLSLILFGLGLIIIAKVKHA